MHKLFVQNSVPIGLRYSRITIKSCHFGMEDIYIYSVTSSYGSHTLLKDVGIFLFNLLRIFLKIQMATIGGIHVLSVTPKVGYRT